MKNLIYKILKEESDFDWAKEIEPLDDFGNYFYGKGDYNIALATPGRYIARDNNWWRNWIEDTYRAHLNLVEDAEDLLDMVKDLSKPRATGNNQYHRLSNEVKNFVRPSSFLGGKSIFEDAANQISNAYSMFDNYANKHNLTILEVLDVFSNWLDKMRKEKKPLHVQDGTKFNID
tara:strand:- start:7958 stop:8482 length:525 start_codon:yes stop_codon:yes gene_type:complete